LQMWWIPHRNYWIDNWNR